MLAIGLEIRIACDACHGPVPVNAFAAVAPCPACGHGNNLEHSWSWLLEEVVKDLEDLVDEEERTARVGPQAKVVYARTEARCEGCKTVVPDEVVGTGERGWVPCVGCGQWLPFRPAPSILASIAPGAIFVAGEAIAQPGEAPAAEPRRWYVCFDARVRGGARPYAPLFDWYNLADALIDLDGNLVCAGNYEPDDEFAVWAMDAGLNTRWWQRELRHDQREARLALAPSGEILVWEPGAAGLELLSPSDGKLAREVGGPEPEDSIIHQLDLTHATSLTVTADGSILTIINNRLLRFRPDGGGLPTWSRKPEAQLPIYGIDREVREVTAVLLDEAGDCPLALDSYARLSTGWDGYLYIERSEALARYDHEGRQLYVVQLPLDTVHGRVGADAHGFAYALGSQGGNRRLVRVSPDGVPEILAIDRRDGTTCLLSYDKRIRVLTPDGRVALLSDTSRRADRETDRRRKTAAVSVPTT